MLALSLSLSRSTSLSRVPKRDRLGGRGVPRNAPLVQGYLAHKKSPPPLGPPQDPRCRAYCRVLGGRCFL